MAGSISILDEAVINRIAAGEVVERPVSVVKELVENSIDAGASAIQVEIENGGKKLIRVRDNGSGMSYDDAFLALERHATSKLRTEKDLEGISTMGFRGEALASIASISRLRLITWDGEDDAGAEITVEGGVIRKADRCGVPRGTVLEIRNLFFNVPVRRKFLKGPGVEAGHIQELIVKLALAFPQIAITYREDGKVKMDAPSVKSTIERIHTLYSKDVRDNLIQVDYSVGSARLHGFVGRPPYARATMRSVQTFVNGRSVRDRLINSAVNRAFANLMERGRYPLAILFVELPADEVDVNVHPQKVEVRFVKSGQIFDLIVDGVYQALTGAPFNPPPGPPEPILPRSPVSSLARHLREEEPRQQPEDKTATGGSIRDRSGGRPERPDSLADNRPDRVPPGGEPPAVRSVHETAAPGRDQRSGRFSSLRVLGALPGSFLVLHSDDELIVMDHHAAHERVLFEDLMGSLRDGRGFETQHLLIPAVLEFSPLEARVLGSNLAAFRASGFEVEEFGENDFVVKSVPLWLGSTDLKEFFSSLVEIVLETGARGDHEKLRTELFKGMACKAAVKETASLHQDEIRALLRDLDRVGSIEVCPHGRPLAVRFPLSEIRRKMGRK